MRGILVAGLVLAASGAWAADPIHGQDAMGDRGRTGPDGWVQAPITRDQSPTGAVNGAAKPGGSAPSAQPAGPPPDLKPGEDPGTPEPPHKP